MAKHVNITPLAAFNDPHTRPSSITRRDLFAAASATALAGIATAATAMPETLAGSSGPDAALIAACERLRRIVDGINSAGVDIEPGDARTAEMQRLVDVILAAVPSTQLGHQIRACAYLEWTGGVGTDGKPASQLNGGEMWPILRDLAGVKALGVRPAIRDHAEPDAALLAACGRYETAFWQVTDRMRRQGREFGATLPDAEYERQSTMLDALQDLECEVAGHRAVTFAGMAAKARVLQLSDGSLTPPAPGEDGGLMWSLTMDLSPHLGVESQSRNP